MISTSPYPDDYEPEGGICNRLLSTNDLTCDVEACHKKIEGAYFRQCKEEPPFEARLSETDQGHRLLQVQR